MSASVWRAVILGNPFGLYVPWAASCIIQASSLSERTFRWETSSVFGAFPTTPGRMSYWSEHTRTSTIEPRAGKSGLAEPSAAPPRV